MARTDNLTNFLTDVADSIREKKGTSEPILASDFDTEIDSIQSGGGSDFKITDASRLFESDARIDAMDELCSLISDDCTNFREMFSASFVEEIPPLNTSKGINFFAMFNSCRIKILPQLDTSNGTDFGSMLKDCSALVMASQIDTSKGTNFNSMFYNCKNLPEIPQIDTSNGTDFGNMFYGSRLITTIPQLDTGNAIKVSSMLSNCTNVTTFGGLKDLGKSYLTSRAENYSDYTLTLSACTLLTYESLMNVINNLYDIASLGVKTQKLVLGSTNLAKLTAEEIAIATERGWSVS